MRCRSSFDGDEGGRHLPAALRRVTGMVTAELAVGLLALSLVLTAALAGVGEVALRIRALDAAHVGARLAARGERSDVVVDATKDRAPAGSVISTDRSSAFVTVSVMAPGLALGLLHLPDLRVSVTGPAEQ